MGLFDDLGDYSLSNDSWDSASSSWGPTFDTSYTDNFDYSSSIFDNPDWFSSNDWTVPDYSSSIFDNPDWFGSLDWSSNLDNMYDPLSDPMASTGDINSYINNMLSNPDLYSLVGGGDFSLGEGSDVLSLSGTNALGSLLSEDPTTSPGTSLSKLLSSLSKMLGGSKTGGILGSQSTNDLVKALLAVMAKRDSNSNQAKNIQTAQQLARSGSQQGLAPNRTGLTNLNTDSRDPMSYVQQAPTIQR